MGAPRLPWNVSPTWLRSESSGSLSRTVIWVPAGIVTFLGAGGGGGGVMACTGGWAIPASAGELLCASTGSSATLRWALVLTGRSIDAVFVGRLLSRFGWRVAIVDCSGM